MQNPTTFFFEQSNNLPTKYLDKINEFVTTLIDKTNCLLCVENFNFTNKIPRILIHCGHTVCTACLKNLYKNNRIRCPLCLKLIKNLQTIERLPVNHTIFTEMAEKVNEQNAKNGKEQIDLQRALYTHFESAQIESQRQQQLQAQQYANQQQYYQQMANQQQMMGGQANNYMQGMNPYVGQKRLDEETGFEWCENHPDRLKHFFCMNHKETCDRVCMEILHTGEDCMVVDLYEIDSVQDFLKEFQMLDGEGLESTGKKKFVDQNDLQVVGGEDDPEEIEGFDGFNDVDSNKSC